MRSFLRQVALSCVAASLLPQVSAAADALHVLLDHGTEHGGAGTADPMFAALHGHAHTAETPDHDHPLTLPSSGVAASHARGPLQLALPVGIDESRASCAPIDAPITGERSTQRQPTQAIPTVLRI